MAARCYRTLSRPAANLLQTSLSKPSSSTKNAFSFHATPSSSSNLSRPLSQLGSLQSFLPLHSAVSSARLTSCLVVDSKLSRSLSQGVLCSANPVV